MRKEHPAHDAPRRARRVRRLPVLLLVSLALLGVRPAIPEARGQEPAVRREDNLVYFNLQNVDIRSALESISEVLGINYVMGGSVQPGLLVTINISEGIPIEEVPDVLDSVLRTYNLTLLRTGDIFTVIPAQDVSEGLLPGGTPTKTQVYVYYLRNANAVDLANVLSQLFQGSAPPGGYTRRSAPSEALSERLEGQQLDFEQPQETPEDAVQVRPQFTPEEFGQVAISGELVGQTSIVPDENTNSLIIRTAPENYPTIEETIRKLDLRPLQVLIEVTIAEILLDESTQFGIDFLITQPDIIGDNDTQTEIELRDPSPIDAGLRVRILDAADVDATFRALAADSRVNVLSTPRILSVNNKEARILVGSEVPFVQFQRSTIAESVDRVVQFRNVGLELTVTPRINPDRYVSLDLLQQVSSLTADVLFDAPIITTREAETSLIVGDRQTVVLGGLIEDRKEKRKSGIPILKDIPILGLLFGSRSTRTIKTELVITLTPYIVDTDLEMQNLRQDIESGTEFYRKDLEKRRKEGRLVPGQLKPGPERARVSPSGAQADSVSRAPATLPDSIAAPAPTFPDSIAAPAPTLRDSVAASSLTPPDSTPGGLPPQEPAPTRVAPPPENGTMEDAPRSLGLLRARRVGEPRPAAFVRDAAAAESP